MIDVASPESMQSKQMIQGWGFSLLLHLGLVFAAATVMPKMKLVAEQEPFKWEVALVERVHDVSSPEVPTPTPKVQTHKPLQSQSARPVEPPPETVMPRVVPQQSMQVIHPLLESPKPEQPVSPEVHPVVQTIQPPQPIQEIAQVQPKPVERQEAKKEEVKEPEPIVQTVQPPQPIQEIVQAQPKPVERQEAKKEEVKEPVVNEFAREVMPRVEPVATAHAYAAPTSAASQPVVEHHAEPVAMAGAAPVAVAEPVSPSPSPTIVAAAPAAARSETVAAPSAPVAHEPPPVVASAPAPRPAMKADYAWLAESLGRRIAALTRYPSSARLNGWEGRVVLRAVIRADGHLLDVTVHKSSGHDALDRAALETVKLACPLHMKHALNSTEVAVYVPIVYSLSG